MIAEHAREGIEPGQAECAAISMRAAADLAAPVPRAAGKLAEAALPEARRLDDRDGQVTALHALAEWPRPRKLGRTSR